MKSTIISMLVVLVVLVALPMIFLGDNKVLDGIDLDIGKPSASTGVKLSSRIETVSTDTPVQIYRWRDAQGVLQFSNTVPPEGVIAEQVRLEPNLTSMDPVAPREDRAATTTVTTSPSPETGNPYTPGGMKQLVDQAHEIKKVLSQQQADQQKAIEDISQKKY